MKTPPVCLPITSAPKKQSFAIIPEGFPPDPDPTLSPSLMKQAQYVSAASEPGTIFSEHKTHHRGWKSFSVKRSCGITHFTTGGNGFTETQVSCPQQGADQFPDLSEMARAPTAASLRSRDLCQPWAFSGFICLLPGSGHQALGKKGGEEPQEVQDVATNRVGLKIMPTTPSTTPRDIFLHHQTGHPSPWTPHPGLAAQRVTFASVQAGSEETLQRMAGPRASRGDVSSTQPWPDISPGQWASFLDLCPPWSPAQSLQLISAFTALSW